MRVTLSKSDVKGSVSVPASKSMTIRALMCAALSKGTSRIERPLVSEDTEAAARVLRQLGIGIIQDEGQWIVEGGTFHTSNEELHCGESATTLRFITAICGLIPGKHRIVGGPSLTQRPVKSLIESLRKLGVNCDMEGKTTPPVTVEGGPLKGGVTSIPGNISSQFISALMLVSPFAQNEVSIKLTTPLASRPYVLMTLWALKQFGVEVKSQVDRFVVSRGRYTPCNLAVEGDWSSASYFLALGTASEGITVDNLRTGSLQGDRVIVEYIRAMGADVRVKGRAVTIGQQALHGIHVDMADCIDLLPTMGVLAALAEGTTVLTGIERARIKESNRVTAVRQGLERLGIPVVEDQDRLTITGIRTAKQVVTDYDAPDEAEKKPEAPPEAAPVVINSFEDHRVAMAFGVLGAIIGGETINETTFGRVIIEGAECVAKTYPDFWDCLKAVGAEMQIDE
jgi:3-phosphoshikimate 1-carboxyvinyltransferase